MSTSDPFTPLELFPIHFYSVRVTDWAPHKTPLEKRILKLRKKHAGVVKSNRNGWHSGPELAAADDPHVKWVIETATRYALRALAPTYGNWERAELQLGTWWANVLDRGGWNAPHHHAPSSWSGTYYVHSGLVGTATGDMSGMLEFENPTGSFGGGARAGNFAIAPKDGTLVLFPSSLVHFVHPYMGDDARISIAYNFNVVPRNP